MSASPTATLEMSTAPDDLCLKMETDPQLAVSSDWTLHSSNVRTVKISNISLSATQQDITEFFSFSGDIDYVELQSESEKSQLAYVVFKDPQGAETATLLSGATIGDLSMTVTLAKNYELPPEAYRSTTSMSSDSAVRQAEDVVSSMLAKGFMLGKDALKRANSFDGRHGLTSNASATVASLDLKIGLTEKINTGTTAVNEKIKEVDERYQVSEITRSALAAAEQRASSAGSAIMSNPYVATGALWVSSALNMVARAAEDVSVMTRVKVEKAEEDKREMVSEFAQFHLDNSSPLLSHREPPTVPVSSADDHKTDHKIE